jgi:hypothetical protein
MLHIVSSCLTFTIYRSIDLIVVVFHDDDDHDCNNVRSLVRDSNTAARFGAGHVSCKMSV